MRLSSLIVIAIMGGALTSANAAQRKGSPNHGGGQPRQGGQNRPSRPSGGQARPTPTRPVQVPQAHARRETVRTPNFVPRPGSFPTRQPSPVGGGFNPPPSRPGNFPNTGNMRRPRPASSPVVQAQRHFTKTTNGRVYDNGLRLRRGSKVTAAWQRHYFPKGHFHFPFYHPTYVKGQCFISPFGFYFGVCVPFISASECHVYPPSVAFIDVPIYNGNTCNGFNDTSDQNFLNDPNLDQDEPGLGNALDQLTETFQGGNIDGLVALIDPNTSIAIYLRGRYKYSLSADDYIDLTRDAIQSMQTVDLSFQYLHQRAPGVFSVAGRQTYRDSSGNVETEWVSFVLQDISGQWTLTQVGQAPGQYRKLAS